MWSKIIKFVAKYGKKAVEWAWEHKWELLALGEAVWDFIKSIWE